MPWYKMIFLYICLTMIERLSLCEINTDHMFTYLSRLKNSTSNKIKETFSDNPATEDIEIHITFDTVQYLEFIYPATSVAAFSVFQNNEIITQDRIYKVVFENNSFTLNLTSNRELTMHEEMKFVRDIQYYNLGLLYVSYDGHSSIYTKNKNMDTMWVHIQSIANEGKVADARFFINQKELYLIIIVSSKNNLPTSAKLYKWSGIHFDETSKVPTVGPIKILSFHNHLREIIIISQDNYSVQEHNIMVYEFKNNSIIKLQLIIANYFKDMILYNFKKDKYLAVFHENENGALYKWNGLEFIPTAHFSNYQNIKNVFSVHLSGIPIIFVVQKNNISVLSHYVDNLKLIGTVPLQDNFKSVFDTVLAVHELNYALLVFVRLHNNKTGYMIIPFFLHIKDIERPEELNEVIICMLNLETVIKNSNPLSTVNKTILHENKPQSYNDTVLASASHSNFQNLSIISNQNIIEVKERIHRLSQQLNDLRDKLNSAFVHSNIKLNDNLVIKSQFHAQNVSGEHLKVEYINGQKWESKQWMSYSKDQTINGKTILKNLQAGVLTLRNSDDMLKGLLVRTGNQTISSIVFCNSITANNIYIERVNDIEFEKLYLRNTPTVIRGVKHFDSVDASETSATYLNKNNATETFLQLANFQTKNYLFTKNVYVKNFNFEEINGVYWNNFKDSVFRLGATNRITGNLSISSIKCNKLMVKKLGKIDPKQLLTTTTTQNVTSSIHWKSIVTKDLICDQINDINLISVAHTNNNVVYGPVSIRNSNIQNNLLVNIVETDLDSEDHIIGTEQADLSQTYTKPIRLVGNLYLSNLSLFNKAKVIVNGKEFRQDTYNEYWLKNKHQVIPNLVHLENGVSTPHLSTPLLNTVPIQSYLTNDLADKLPIKWVFENVTIMGNVDINPLIAHLPNIQELASTSVKITGRYNITDQKNVLGHLRVNNLVTNYLDGLKITDVWSSETNINSKGEKIFENLIVQQDIICNTISTNILNNVELEGLKSTALYIDKDEYIDTVYSVNVTTGDLNPSFINNVDMESYKKRVNEIYTISELTNLNINGNVKIVNAENLFTINQIDIRNLMETAFDRNRPIFSENVKIDGNVFTQNIEVALINGINLVELMPKVLYRIWNQNITGFWTFDQLNTPNIFVPQINEIAVKNLVHIKSNEIQNLTTWGGIYFNNVIFKKSIHAEKMLCNLKSAVSYLQNPPTQLWNTVYVVNNVTLWDNECSLNVIMNTAVNLKQENVIQSQVTFEHYVSLNHAYVQAMINGVYLNDIFNDALLKGSYEQIVTGKKRFYRLDASQAITESVDIPVINEISIRELNESIIHKDNLYNTIITGSKLFFGGIQAVRLLTRTISDMEPHNLVNLDNLSVIQSAYFLSLTIEANFDFEFANNINMSNFMYDRLRCRSSELQLAKGVYYFDDLVLLGNSSMASVNNIDIADIVFDSDTQLIESDKYFMNKIMVDGNATVEFVNRDNLSTLYKNSILVGEDNVIEGYIRFNNVSLSTDVQTDNINKLSLDYIQKFLVSSTPVIEDKVIKDTVEKLDNVIETSLNLSKGMSDYYLYLEAVNDLQISFTNVSRARTFKSQDGIMLFVTQHESGNICGLKSTCICPSQKVLQITSENSINVITESSFDKVYSFESENTSMHLTTNSVSTSEMCSKKGNESTFIMWMTFSQNGGTEHYYYPKDLTGFISGVEYFTHKGNMFLVVSRFYESTQNTHNVSCLIMKVPKERGDVQVIQRIETHNAWVLHLFHTVQGVVIIIGAFSTSEKINGQFGISIYRFDEVIEKFTLLRKVPNNGCTSAVGVTSGPDSLFILAYKDAPVQVFKYHPTYDNYYFYQNIFTESPVIDLSTFYGGDDPYLCVVTKSGQFYIYSFKFVQRWEILSSGEIEGLQILIPFHLHNSAYLFAITQNTSILLNVVKHGFN